VVYSPNQVAGIYPYIRGWVPDAFILGGPADGDEGQRVKAQWPSIRVLGFEPCLQMYEYQMAHGFPDEGGSVLLCQGLWSKSGPNDHFIAHGRHSTFSRAGVIGASSTVSMITLDEVSICYGPFSHAILWLDIEGAELEALRGATGMFARREVAMVNLEFTYDQPPEITTAIEALLDRSDLRYVTAWNTAGGIGEDRIYLHKDLDPGRIRRKVKKR
jgi:FkbM family methyltransferase